MSKNGQEYTFLRRDASLNLPDILTIIVQKSNVKQNIDMGFPCKNYTPL